MMEIMMGNPQQSNNPTTNRKPMPNPNPNHVKPTEPLKQVLRKVAIRQQRKHKSQTQMVNMRRHICWNVPQFQEFFFSCKVKMEMNLFMFIHALQHQRCSGECVGKKEEKTQIRTYFIEFGRLFFYYYSHLRENKGVGYTSTSACPIFRIN